MMDTIADRLNYSRSSFFALALDFFKSEAVFKDDDFGTLGAEDLYLQILKKVRNNLDYVEAKSFVKLMKDNEEWEGYLEEISPLSDADEIEFEICPICGEDSYYSHNQGNHYRCNVCKYDTAKDDA